MICSTRISWPLALVVSLAFSVQPVDVLAAEPPRPLVVGHRGLMNLAPECTLAAFRGCVAMRCGFEFDVRRTKDGQLVCLHDPTLDRTTNGRGNLADLNFAEVRKLDAGSRFDPAFHSERIPSIDEIFALIAEQSHGQGLFAVDLKEAGDGLEDRLVRLAEARKILDRLLFIGLTIESPDVRSRLKKASPQAPTARLAATSEEITSVLADKDSDWVYVRVLPTPDDIRRIHSAGKRIFIAGPLVAGAEPANWKKATDLGIDAILTDHPLDLAKQLRGNSANER